MEGLRRAAGIEVLMRRLSAIILTGESIFLPSSLSPLPSQASSPPVTIESHVQQEPIPPSL